MRFRALPAIFCLALVGAASVGVGAAQANTEKFWEMGGVKQTKKFTFEFKANYTSGGLGGEIQCPTHSLITGNENNIASSTGLIHFSLDEEFTKKCVGTGGFAGCQVKEVEGTNGATLTWTYHLTETPGGIKEMVITEAAIKMVLEPITGKTCGTKKIKTDFPKAIAIPDIAGKISTFTFFSEEGIFFIEELFEIEAELSGTGEIQGSDKETWGLL